MYHFRKNVFPTPRGATTTAPSGRSTQGAPAASGGRSDTAEPTVTVTTTPAKSSQNRTTASTSSTHLPRAPSSIHYNIATPLDIMENFTAPRRKETPAQIRERKRQEYKTKKRAEKYGLVTPTSSFDHYHNSSNAATPTATTSPPYAATRTAVSYDGGDLAQKENLRSDEVSVPRAKTYDWNEGSNHNDPNNNSGIIQATRSEDILSRQNHLNNLDEREQIIQTRSAGKLSELYYTRDNNNNYYHQHDNNNHNHMDDPDYDDDGHNLTLNRNAVFRQNEKTSIIGALSADAKAANKAMQQGYVVPPTTSTTYETPAQIRERKKQEYKTKKRAEKYGIITPTSSFDRPDSDNSHSVTRGFTKKSVSYDESEFAHGNMTNSSSSWARDYHTLDDVPRVRTYDWNGGNNSANDIPAIRTAGSDDILSRPNTSFDERTQTSRARADRLSELYAMNHDHNDDDYYQGQNNNSNNSIFRQQEKTSIVGALSADAKSANREAQQGYINTPGTMTTPTSHKFRHETPAQIRERKKQEYKAKKRAEKYGVLPQVGLTSSFDSSLHYEESVDSEGVEVTIRGISSFDHVNRNNYDNVYGDSNSILHSQSDGAMLLRSNINHNNLAFDEVAQISRARADQLSALYAKSQNNDNNAEEDGDDMKLIRNPVFKQQTTSSIAGALSMGVAAEKWAQERQAEARRLKKGGVYVGQQVTPTSSFDIIAAEFASASQDAHEHHPTKNGYLAANGKIYDVPSLC